MQASRADRLPFVPAGILLINVQPSYPSQVGFPYPRGLQMGIAPPGAPYATAAPSNPQITATPGQSLNPRLRYSRPQPTQAVQPAQPIASGGVHLCQPATIPTSPYFTIICKNGGTVHTRIPVYASPTNPTIVTLGDVLGVIDWEMIGLERVWEGNDPYGSAGPSNGGPHGEDPCLCLCAMTAIDYFRDRYRKAGLVESDEGPYVWEWKVKRQR